MDKIAFGKKIKQARKEKKWTQEQFAEKADISVIFLSEIERGIKLPSLSIFFKMVEILDVSVDYLFRDEIPSGTPYVIDEIGKKLEKLTPQQRKFISDIIDSYLKNICEVE